MLTQKVSNTVEKKVFSQNGEDGIISHLLHSVGSSTKVFVEIGVGDGIENNTRLLATQGWSGFWFSPDVPAENVPSSVVYSNCMVVPRTASAIFSQAGVPKEFDLLSIDIDGEDYWVWDSLSEFTPKVVVIEYNAAYRPPASVSVPYNDSLIPTVWDCTNYFGASVVALTNLAKKKGYRLVACDRRGVNIFFVAEKYCAPSAEITPEEAYNVYGYWSHPQGKPLTEV